MIIARISSGKFVLALDRDDMLRIIHGHFLRARGTDQNEIIVIAANCEIDVRATLLRAGAIAPSTQLEIMTA
jgi:hypothetical protein